MTKADACKNAETMKLFYEADYDGSGIISQGELEDYNYSLTGGPSIKVNDKYLIYPGKNIYQNNSDTFLHKYSRVDLDGDNKISENEFNQFLEMIDFEKEYKEKIAEYKKLKGEPANKIAEMTTGCLIAGLSMGIDGVRKNSKNKFTRKIAEKFIKNFGKHMILSKFIFVAGLTSLIGGIGFFAAKKMFPIPNLDNESKELDNMSEKMQEYYEKYGLEHETVKI